MDVGKSRELSVSRSRTSSWKWSPCQAQLSAGMCRKCPVDPTFFALINGPGNVPKARVELQHNDWIRRRFRQHSVDTHWREYPSGAIFLLTIRRVARGPRSKDSTPEKATRGKRTWRSRTIEKKNAKRCVNWPWGIRRQNVRHFIRYTGCTTYALTSRKVAYDLSA